jgi:rRNA maturation endonuclease Nob1
MEIVLNDTNILIDLYNAGLLPYCKKLNLDFRTLDVIINEIEDSEQYAAVQSIIDEGTLSVHSLTGEQVGTVFQKVAAYNGVCNLSVEDISVMVYAIDNNCRLLTGDKKLKDKATLENVKVSGILFLTDMLTKESVVDGGEMITALERLLSSNNRLPKKLIKERIETLKRQTAL